MTNVRLECAGDKQILINNAALRGVYKTGVVTWLPTCERYLPNEMARQAIDRNS